MGKKRVSLQADLDQLAREDPKVAASAKACDDFARKAQVEFRRRAYELVERELMAAGVSTISFQHLPKGGACAVGAWYHGGPLKPGSLKWVADHCEPRSAVEARFEAAAKARCEPAAKEGRCECGTTLAYYSGAGASGVLCPECDRDHADELEPGERP